MIKLTKSAEPEILVERAELWRHEYLDLLAGREGVPEGARDRYRNADVRDALRVETFEKCAYCESRILHVTFDHIEHIIPKSQHPELVVTWTNLTIACPKCNVAKADYYSETEPLLHPYSDEPAEHLLFVGPVALQRPGSGLGFRTVSQLDLSRSHLIEQRTERIRRIHPLLDQWARASGPERKRLLENEIRREGADEKEFSACVRSYLVQSGFPIEVEPA